MQIVSAVKYKMKLIESLDLDTFSQTAGTCVCIGIFDGVHKGHQSLIAHTILSAKENNQPSVVLTFKENPKHSRSDSLSLTSFPEKAAMIESLGIDFLVAIPFSEEVSTLTPIEFMEKILVQKVKASSIFIGANFRFGHKRSGNKDDLSYFSSERNIHLMVQNMILYHGMAVSSSLCRESIHRRNLNVVSNLLGYHYFISGTVTQGHKRGSSLGMPTVNLLENYPEKIKPDWGVYLTETLYKGDLYPSLTHIGPVPTFHQSSVSIETTLLDFNQSIYGESITVFFGHWLRGIEKFHSENALKKQLSMDKEYARNYFSGIESQNNSVKGKWLPLLDFLKKS